MDDTAGLDDKAVELRAEGRSFGSIAKILGYPTAHDANEAFNRALRRRPKTEQARIRDEELTRLDKLSQRVQDSEDLSPEDVSRYLQGLHQLRARLLVE
jgi:hypothetical protein